ncbi:hypothetical protein [Arthrobacter sp. 4R501]|uniref:hypothetical protein n=1 Tax=Arthrobacter sp. 4R501 TaxID=2058886 RepID=UPI000CE50BD8|nr:hypothetical protein [Arthrobacter sp. 4R501]
MAQPGQFRPPNDEGWMGREITDIKRQIRELSAANVFGLTGIRPKNGGTEFEGYVTINGPATITGTLDLPAGIIGNDALTSPVQIGTASNGVNNYAIGTASTVRASVALTVPAGFTQAVVTANPTAMGQNSTATTDYLYVMAVVQGINGGELYTSAGAGLGVGLAAPFHTTLTGLTGGEEIVISVATRAGFNTWAASTANQANIYATALFLR